MCQPDFTNEATPACTDRFGDLGYCMHACMHACAARRMNHITCQDEKLCTVCECLAVSFVRFFRRFAIENKRKSLRSQDRHTTRKHARAVLAPHRGHCNVNAQNDLRGARQTEARWLNARLRTIGWTHRSPETRRCSHPSCFNCAWPFVHFPLCAFPGHLHREGWRPAVVR